LIVGFVTEILSQIDINMVRGKIAVITGETSIYQISISMTMSITKLILR